jgi:hypothetical protein
MFPIVSFSIRQILGIVGSHIKIEKKHLLARILSNLQKCHLQIENLEKWTFVNKNWLNELRVECKPPSNLI